MRSLALLPAALFLAAASPALALTITLNPSTSATRLSVDAAAVFSVDNDLDSPTSLTTATQSAVAAPSEAETSYTLSNQGFDLTVEHTRAGAVGYHPMFGMLGSGAGSSGDIHFSLDTQINYVISGQYSAVDPDGASIVFTAFLFDNTLGQTLVLSSQSSASTPNESFVLGLTEGDEGNFLIGSLTGTLLAGHEYWFSYGASIETLEVEDQGATATGSVSLTFVPEPSALLLVATGLAALAWSVRRDLSA